MAATVLVIEDDTRIADDVRRALDGLGYVVGDRAVTRRQALEAIERLRPRLIVVDERRLGSTGAPTEPAGAGGAVARVAARLEVPIAYLAAQGQDGVRRAVESARDLHETERRLRARELWLAAMLESIDEGVITIDPAGRIGSMNAVAERLTGWTAAEAAGRPVDEVFDLRDSEGARAQGALAAALAREAPTDLRSADAGATESERSARASRSLRRRSGEALAFDGRARAVVDDAGAPLGGLVAFCDLSGRARLEQRLAQSERLASIGTMAAGMAHEINNPLAYVITNIGLCVEGLLEATSHLAEQGQTRATAELHDLVEVLREANEGADRVRRIVQDLRKFTRVQDGSLSVIDLADVLEAASKITANSVRHHARLRKEYGATPLVEADEGQLTQVFTNILINAAQAIGEGHAEHNEIVVSTYTDPRGRAVVEVSDTGPGIPTEALPRIFDPFFTSKPAGTGMGLGLTICQNIIRSLGGEITAETRPGAGATFRVALPPTRSSSTRTRAAQPAPSPNRRGRVLVVDDEVAVAKSIARILRSQHDVRVETDPQQALAALLEGPLYDVVFCDVMMPSMSGIDLYRAVAASSPDQAKRIVFVTGGAFSTRSQAFLETVGNVSVAKPFAIQAIRAIVNDFVK